MLLTANLEMLNGNIVLNCSLCGCKCNFTPTLVAGELSLTFGEPKLVYVMMIVLILKIYNYNNNNNRQKCFNINHWRNVHLKLFLVSLH